MNHEPQTSPITTGGGPRPQAPTMQDVIIRLQEFWAGLGCVVSQPVNTEVGAGTANPSTALRVQGPEPWRVAYVEPSVRPDDSRYGENPNRLQTHTQYQVILKPDPGNPQELYLESLAALGIDTRAHDVRFVEDNWASPALGAWGLGWEVWLDGLEITQFTYFQQAGGLTLDPVSVEITYGLERIVMALQGVSHFTEIRYTDDISYGEVFAQSEYEMSRYYLDDADVELQQRLFDAYAAEAQRMLELSLPVPAYSYVLKCSHAFNVLDSRGAVSTTARARSFALMRRLMRQVSQLWVDRRAELGHPLGTVQPPALPVAPVSPVVTGTSTLLVEIGVEELPHEEVRAATEAVRESLTSLFAASQLPVGEVRVTATPRRVVAVVAAVPPAEVDSRRTVRGPRVSAAYADNEPTKALLGFLRSQGAQPDEVRRVDVNGVLYVSVVKEIPGRQAVEVVADVVAQTVRRLSGPTNMRWRDPELAYVRPIRWLTVLLGSTLVPVAVSSLLSGTTTRVLRHADDPEIEVHSADDHIDLLAKHGITLDRDSRRAEIVDGAQRLAASVGGFIDVEGEADLIDQVTDLVEAPHPLLGSFDRAYLDVPSAVLTTVMRKHQRYLPVLDSDGALMPFFVAVANGPCDEALVRAGNEAVLRARYEDASFFWRADQQASPSHWRARLSSLTFEERLGTVDDRVRRIAAVANEFADVAGLGSADRDTVRRAGELGKFDQATSLVVELSSLAGTMAQEYALRAGEPQAVAVALREMELPSSATSSLPGALPGAVLSLADRFDLIISMYAVGAVPTGTSDPYGVRRAAIGVVRVLRSSPALVGVSVSAGVAHAAQALREAGVEVADEILEAAADFVRQRYELQLLDAGTPRHLLSAVLPLADQPARADDALNQLQAATELEAFADVAAAFQRARRLLAKADADELRDVTPAPLTDPAEVALADALDGAEVALRGREGDLVHVVRSSAPLPVHLSRFFDDLQVLTDDRAVRAARLRLLRRMAALGGRLDWEGLARSEAHG